MQKEQKKTVSQRSQRSGEDRRKVHTFLLQERRLGPFCRRHAQEMVADKRRSSKYWDWRSGQWKPLQ